MAETVLIDDPSVSIQRPALYVIATPIGNLADISQRAIAVLHEVDLILVEDSRVSAKLLKFYGINTQTRSVHDHNEDQVSEGVASEILEKGLAMAQISDAGTPLISDPGYVTVNAAIRAGIPVIAVPGPCAAIAALSISGLPTNQFLFIGFLSAKLGTKRKEIAALLTETRTLIFYEAPHRIESTLSEMAAGFGLSRQAVVARELTKRFETVYRGSLGELSARCCNDMNMKKGELVILLEASATQVDNTEKEAQRVLGILLDELPTSRAIKLAAEITGVAKNALYDMAHKDR